VRQTSALLRSVPRVGLRDNTQIYPAVAPSARESSVDLCMYVHYDLPVLYITISLFLVPKPPSRALLVVARSDSKPAFDLFLSIHRAGEQTGLRLAWLREASTTRNSSCRKEQCLSDRLGLDWVGPCYWNVLLRPMITEQSPRESREAKTQLRALLFEILTG
jgi:hypothetical protein